ncbi:PLP-dependent aminotransferase family protein [Pseudoduganella ginsengisoli]|uniref:Aminotransferase class I/II-fold pyridoxal phosphate-dependent enzyme n=1 Tax=Pseudoduganella ginsengisoli TaxID=1462440 RepID=A0A6L6Q6U6_9BURK|nr:PLP-dependent aminotransferase family protein [Pseudoduganella ginsengisoli]MTW05174.1 aminotransferase class I/II-fold pyridoxal phosphate-dependent enzyme [Pseudoduganella ginsengisoli]
MSQAAGAHTRLDVMNFLNEISARFPAAISFASGRPAQQFIHLQQWMGAGARFVDYFADEKRMPEEQAYHLLGQYGNTNGIINGLIARQVRHDHGIACLAGEVLVTAGGQEAIDLCVRQLCSEPGDVLLARTPTYIGATGVADLHGIEIAGFRCDDEADMADALAAAVARLEQHGKRPRALYLVPDFDNPSASVLSYATRMQLIAYCAAQGIVVLEDNPYGMFRYEGETIPPMYALDSHGCVVFLGTYSKTICPALRVGFAIVPERMLQGQVCGKQVMAQLSQAKSFSTLNTSQVSQAIVGGILLDQQCSLRASIEPAVAYYRGNRDTMLACLDSAFKEWPQQITWNVPQGGFFLVLKLPFDFGAEEADICARQFGVIVMPLSFFALAPGHERHVRLAFSNVGEEAIAEGVKRFAAFVRQRLQGQ